jgi:hypothetical protein
VPAVTRADPLALLWDEQRRASEASEALAADGKPGEAADRLKALLAENPDSPEVNYNLGTYLLQDKKLEEGREQLGRLAEKDGPHQAFARYNIAGSYALEKKKDEARAAYAGLIRDLTRKSERTEAEEALLRAARENLARLADPSQDQQQNQQPQDQQGGGGGQDQKKNDQGKSGKPNEQNDGNDQKEKEKKEQDQKTEGQDSGEEQKKEGKDPEEKGDGKNEEQPRQIPRSGRRPFKEREEMGEDEAKRILEALKQREGALQKKFLKNQNPEGKVSEDGKDW